MERVIQGEEFYMEKILHGESHTQEGSYIRKRVTHRETLQRERNYTRRGPYIERLYTQESCTCTCTTYSFPTHSLHTWGIVRQKKELHTGRNSMQRGVTYGKELGTERSYARKAVRTLGNYTQRLVRLRARFDTRLQLSSGCTFCWKSSHTVPARRDLPMPRYFHFLLNQRRR